MSASGPALPGGVLTATVLVALAGCGRTSIDSQAERKDTEGAGTTANESGGSAAVPDASAPDDSLPVPGAEGTLDWRVQLGSDGSDTAADVAVGPDGTITITGWTDGAFGAESLGSSDAIFARLSPSGELIWRTQFGSAGTDTAYGVAVDQAGNVFAAGDTDGEIEGARRGEEDAFLVKLAADGSLIWKRQLGTQDEDSAFDVAVDQEGDPVIVGSTEGALGGPNVSATDMFAARYSNAGDPLWAWQQGAPITTWERDRADGVAIDSSGEIVVAGRTTGLFGEEYFGQDDVVLVKLSAAGEQRWAVQFGSVDFDVAYAVTTDGNDNVLAAGLTHGALGEEDSSGDGGFVAKYTPSGQRLWITRHAEGEASTVSFQGVATDPTGAIFAAGYVYHDETRPELGDAYAVVAKFSADGELVWLDRLASGTYDSALGVATDPTGGVVVVGYTSGSLASELRGVRDLFVAKYR